MINSKGSANLGIWYFENLLQALATTGQAAVLVNSVVAWQGHIMERHLIPVYFTRSSDGLIMAIRTQKGGNTLFINPINTSDFLDMNDRIQSNDSPLDPDFVRSLIPTKDQDHIMTSLGSSIKGIIPIQDSIILKRFGAIF